MADTQGLTAFGRWARRHPRAGILVVALLLPVYCIAGAGIGLASGCREGLSGGLSDLKRIRSAGIDHDK